MPHAAGHPPAGDLPIVGLIANRYVAGVSDFLVAGRSLRTRLGIATMIGSELGLVTAM